MNSTSSMTKEEVLCCVVKTMNEVLSVPSEKITERSRLVEDLGVDSLDAVEVVMALEEKLGKRFEDVDRDEILTVQDIVNYISCQMATSSQRSGSEVA